MKNIPNKIYLQVDPENEKPEFFDELGTTWCSDRINDNDIPYYRKQVKVEPEVILPKANPQVFTLADLEKAYNDGYKNGIMNEAGLECEPFDVWYNWVHVIKSKNRSEA